MKRVAEIREEIAQNVRQTRYKTFLKDVCVVSDLMRRACDSIEHTTLTEEEWNKVSIINNIVNIEDPRRLRLMQRIGSEMSK